MEDFFIPNDLNDLDELWRQVKKPDINELSFMKSGSRITQRQFVGLRVICPMLEGHKQFERLKAKYGLKETWKEVKIIVKSDREARNYFEAIRKKRNVQKDIPKLKAEGWPGDFVPVLNLQQQTVTVDGVHDDEHTGVGRVKLEKNCAMPKTRTRQMQLSFNFWQFYPSSWRLRLNGLVTVFRLRQNSRRRNIRLKLTAP